MSQTELEHNQTEEPEQEIDSSISAAEPPETDPFAQFDNKEAVAGEKNTVFQPTEVFNANPAATATNVNSRPENVVAGIVGAFLFSLIGGAAYFLIYQMGYIAGICGLICGVLAAFGYGLFSGKKNTVKGVVISIILTVITLFLAEYFCLSFEVYKAYADDYGITFLDALRATPAFLVDPEILPSVLGDLLIAYGLAAVASFSNIRAAIRASKAQKNQAK